MPTPATLRDLRRAARLHDIGKLAISNLILDKPAPLTPAEFATVKDHPRITQLMLERVPGLREVAALAGAHHERFDGSGYPHGWAAAELTMPMRALAVADVYDALTSARPYRPARSSRPRARAHPLPTRRTASTWTRSSRSRHCSRTRAPRP